MRVRHCTPIYACAIIQTVSHFCSKRKQRQDLLRFSKGIHISANQFIENIIVELHASLGAGAFDVLHEIGI
jgi:hypothetical protein